MRFKIGLALKLEVNFSVFALFYFVFEGNFPSSSPWGFIMEGRFNGGFSALPDWGAYIWRGLYIWYPLCCHLILMGDRMRVKSSGIAPGFANVRPPGSAKFANAPPPGMKRRQMPRGSPGRLGAAGLD